MSMVVQGSSGFVAVADSSIDVRRSRQRKTVRPSLLEQAVAVPFTLDQELKPFGTWVGSPLWVPPKNASDAMAEFMLRHCSPFSSKSSRWQTVVAEHRDNFTQVREIELVKASIRLPKGKLFVSVTEPHHFDRIEDTVPHCVQTRLDEFMAGPGKRPGVNVFYLKPLCVEVDDALHFTSRIDIDAAIAKIQDEVFTRYRETYLWHRAETAIKSIVKASVAIPHAMSQAVITRRQRAVDAFQARLEFKRRQIALRAARQRAKCRTDNCSFEDMLALTNPLQRQDVIRQYGVEHELSQSKRRQMLMHAAGHVPWFTALSIGLSYLSSLSLEFAPAIVVCDPAFVAEFPEAPGVLLNIGHFDDVAGICHVEM